MEQTRVKLEQVYKRFGKTNDVISDFNLEVYDNEFLVMVGPSGCGKSTLLRLIAGLEELTSGNIYIAGQKVNDVPPQSRNVAMVFQNYALYPHMTVYDNMAFSLKMNKLPRDEIRRKVNEAASILNIESHLRRLPRVLSGGERQRVALGRAMVREPKVFLMDEPLSNLDAQLRTHMRSEILNLHQKLNTTFIFVTHDQIEAMTMGSRIVVMKEGRIQQVARPQEIFEQPANMFVAGFIGNPPMNLVEARLERSAEAYLLSYTGYECLLAPEQCSALKERKVVSQMVVSGFRPEDVRIAADNEKAIPCRVIISELMGSEAYLHLQAADMKIVARVQASLGIKPRQNLRVKFVTEKAHLFDPQTQQNLFL
jgi:multiple sugar transport system ATP-binding protein